MPRPRFLNLPLETRDRLLGLAVAEFAAKGFDDASLNAVLSAAGISKGACYYYFDDKEDLFATALQNTLGQVLGRDPLPPIQRLTSRTFWSAVGQAIRHWTELFNSPQGLLKAALHFSATRRHSPRFQGVMARGLALWQELIDKGQRLGCVRTDLPTTLLVELVTANDQALDMAFAAAHPEPSRRDFETHVGQVLDTLRRLLAVAPRHRSPRRRGGRSP